MIKYKFYLSLTLIFLIPVIFSSCFSDSTDKEIIRKVSNNPKIIHYDSSAVIGATEPARKNWTPS